MKHLKYTYLARITEAGSEKAQDLFFERMTNLKCDIYKFFIIKKEVHILAYSLGINGTLILPIT